MSKSSDLTRRPTADLLIPAAATLLLGSLLLAVGLWLWATESESAPLTLVLGMLGLVGGGAALTAACVRAAEKLDDVHRIAVARHEREEAARLEGRRDAATT